MVELEKMQVDQENKSKKRSYKEAFFPDEISKRFKSKYDLRYIMSEHRKSINNILMNIYSATFDAF